MQTSGNTVLITGGTSGIGLAFAKEFMVEGSEVIICGRREDRLRELKETFPHLITKACDIQDADQRKELADWTIQNYPAVNILINNAGIQLATDLTKPVDLEKIQSEIETNFIAPVHLSSLLIPHLITKGEAAVINISSGLAFTPLAFVPVYCATKAAIHSFTLSLRYQLRNTKVKVFEIAPPSVDTELGYQRREDPTQSHGGIPVSQFIEEAMEAIQNDMLEAPVGMSKNFREKREGLFAMLNP